LLSLSLVEAANGAVQFSRFSFCAATPVGINVKGQFNSLEDLLGIGDDDDKTPNFAGEAPEEIEENVMTC
jgi:hypothetical protein